MNSFCAPFSHEQAKRCCAHLLARYPFAAVSVLGRTAAGRAIFALHVGAPAGAPVLYVSGLSGRDAAGSEALYRFFDCACRAVLRDTTLCGVKLRRTLQSRRLVVVPCLNPDGVEICRTGVFGAGVYAGLVGRAGAKDLSAWPCNARGVALAHNFDYRHAPHPFSTSEKDGAHAGRYAGPAPESEAETAALARLCRRTPFRQAMLLSGEGGRLFWSAPKDLTDAPLMARVLASAGDFTLSKKGEPLLRGSFPAWFAETLHAPAFELAVPGSQPPQALWQTVREALLLAALL